jgi:hypothetical protein
LAKYSGVGRPHVVLQQAIQLGMERRIGLRGSA